MGYFENNIYIQTPHSCVRNKAINNFNTSSDFCVFSRPEYTMSGASKLPCDADYSATTTATTYAFGITTATTQDLTFEFTANTSEFVDTNAVFKFEVFKLDTDVGYWQYPPIYQSDEIEWSSFSGTSAYTESVSLTTLDIDGDYLVKGYFIHDVCTEFSNRLGYRNDTSLVRTGEYFGLYEPNFDYYMALFREADTPIFDGDTLGSNILSLKQRVVIPEDGQTVFILPGDVEVDFIVTINGLTLSKGLDYSTEQYSGGTQPYVITLIAPTKATDIVTFIYGSTSSGGLMSDTFDVTAIPSGATDEQGTSDVYYNTDTSKYEMFLTLTPSSGNDILVMINGVTLANGVDYYQSISNPKRIIFVGNILVGDVITAVYNQSAEFVGSVNTATPTILWNIANAPSLVNGEFILEFASDDLMGSQVSSASTNYEVGVRDYGLSTTISGTVGTQLYYRVTNIKNYETFCGNVIQSIAYSDIVPITIATNSINSY